MASKIPAELKRLLLAETSSQKSEAWEGFVGSYSRILLHASRNGSSSPDQTMDQYAFVLEALKADDFSRLRSFHPDGRARFSTWLHVVARRLCVDHHRRRLGRKKASDDDAQEGSAHQEVRYRLAHLISEELEVDQLPDSAGVDAESRLWNRERDSILEAAIRSLPPRDRLMITLRFQEGLSVREISRIMSFRSPFQVYRRLRKVLDGLRRELLSKGISGP